MPHRDTDSRGVDVTLIVHRHEKHRYDIDRAGLMTVPHLVVALLVELQRRGTVRDLHVAGGPEERRSDVAILHVNASVVSQEYVDFGASFPICVNGSVTDISKRSLDAAAVGRDWDGPVIVKSDLNYRGIPEERLNRRARETGESEPYPGIVPMADYLVYERLGDVPAHHRDGRHTVVQRFVPEPDELGYAIRHWVFCGDEGYCYRYVSSEPILKGANVVSKEPAPVPEQLRRARRELGFDYGKFDFVVHGDDVELFDVNKTPGAIPAGTGDATERVAMLADGLERLLAGARV